MGRINLRGIRAFGRHGANPGERDNPQPFDIDLTIELDLARAQATDNLEDTLDYAALHAKVVDTVAATSYALIERLAAQILDVVLQDERVAQAKITIAKPAILDGATPSISISAMQPRCERP